MSTKNTAPDAPKPPKPEPGVAQDLRSFHKTTKLPDDFDKELGKAGARDADRKEELLSTLRAMGEEMLPQVSKWLGRKVQTVEPFIEPGMKVGSFTDGFALFFVDSVERGDLAIFPVAEGTDATAGKAARYPAERGRLVVFPNAANYVLHATASRARAVLIFT